MSPCCEDSWDNPLWVLFDYRDKTGCSIISYSFFVVVKKEETTMEIKNIEAQAILEQVNKVIIGKEEVIKKVFTAILAGGHILLEDIPGVGKTTMALAFSKAMNLSFKRVQFTPDVVPSDITGFSMYDKNRGEFVYSPGAVMCHFLMADEINRTSSKTQSALLEVMEEGYVTVDQKRYEMKTPFIVLATQNPVGTIGTQTLPEAQLDRFMVQLSVGYPDTDAQVTILKDRGQANPLDNLESVAGDEEICRMKEQVKQVFVDEKILRYITALTEATRKNPKIKLGVSPRGALALMAMGRSAAMMVGRDYVIPQDIETCFFDVCCHRVIPDPKAHLNRLTTRDVLAEILENTEKPVLA